MIARGGRWQKTILPCSRRATCDDVNGVHFLALSATYHSADIQKRMIISLILWNALDTALLDVESRRESLDLRVGRISLHKGLTRNSATIAAPRSSTQNVLLLHVMHIGIVETHLGQVARSGRRRERCQVENVGVSFEDSSASRINSSPTERTTRV